MPEFCDLCKYLAPKEYHQTEKNEHHICTKYGKRVRHLGYHPEIFRLSECDEPRKSLVLKERPTIFSSEMVRAILKGRKTQTRRVVKPQPGDGMINVLKYNRLEWPCSYGQSGDRLWVRETWAAIWPGEVEVPLRDCNIEYRADLPIGCTDYPGGWPASEARGYDGCPKWRASIHMPRWASRITLEITEVRVERLQDITESAAMSEGVEKSPIYADRNWNEYRPMFREFWDSINAKRGYSWASTPWVWVISFTKVTRSE